MQISTDKKRVLVVSDVHQEVARLKYILKHDHYDLVVCLGDWFDSHHTDSEKDVKDTCEFLKGWVFKDNFVTLIGNHDVPYLYGNPTTICSGFSRMKYAYIDDYYGNALPAFRDKFLWYVWIDDFLCTHAGLHPNNIGPMVKLDKASLSTWLDGQIAMAQLPLINNGPHWLYSAGKARGGRMPFGGINWLDFKHEFEPIEGLKQIVGHTNHRKIVSHAHDGHASVEEADNIDIDCNLSEYLVIENGKVTVRKYSDL